MAHPTAPQLTIGVDTHLDVHVAHAADQLGRRVATVQVPTTPAGYQHLLAWARGLGQPVAWGVEGTGSYGAALARFLAANHQVVVEVNRPDRAARRRRGKSDPLDAQAAAKAVQAGDATVVPKAGTGQVEMIRSLRVARSTAMRARTQTINALKALLVTAPAELREQLRGMSLTRLVRAAADLEPGPITSPLAAAMLALGTLARRHQVLSGEIDSLTSELDGWSPRRRPGWWRCSASAKTAPAHCWSPPATTRAGCAATPALRCYAAPRRSRRPPARPPGIASIGAATGRPTRRCTGSWWCGCATTSRPRTTWPGASPKARPRRRSSAA
jgi:transposase